MTCVSPRLGGGRCEEHGGGEDPLHGEMLAGAGAGGDCGLGSGSQLPAADLEPVHQQAAGRRRHQEPACSHTTAWHLHHPLLSTCSPQQVIINNKQSKRPQLHTYVDNRYINYCSQIAIRSLYLYLYIYFVAGAMLNWRILLKSDPLLINQYLVAIMQPWSAARMHLLGCAASAPLFDPNERVRSAKSIKLRFLCPLICGVITAVTSSVPGPR